MPWQLGGTTSSQKGIRKANMSSASGIDLSTFYKSLPKNGAILNSCCYEISYQANKCTCLLPTPRSQDSYERTNWKTIKRIAEGGGDLTLPRCLIYNASNRIDRPTDSTPNPAFWEKIMGYEIGWTKLNTLTSRWLGV